MKRNKRNTRLRQLQELLKRRSGELSEAAARSGGQVPGDRLEELERLKRLVEAEAVFAPVPRHIQWQVIVLLVATLSIVSILLFARVRTTEIELDLSLSEFGFRLPSQQVLASLVKVSGLGVSGLRQVELPFTGALTNQDLSAAADSATSILLSQGPGLLPAGADVPQARPDYPRAGTDSLRAGTITLATLAPPRGAHIWIRSSEIPQQYRLSINATPFAFRADVNGPVEIGLPGMPRKSVDFKIPRSVVLQSGPNAVDIDISLLSSSKGHLSRQLIADSLSFFHIDEHFDQEESLVRRVSTVLSGSLFFESLGGQELRLRPGEEIAFGLSEGEIRTLELRDNHIGLTFHGRVQGMTSGVGEHLYSIMPTWLEWLKARHGLSLLWGTTLYFFGLVLSIWRWWRASK
jgi:hypothetical protein